MAPTASLGSHTRVEDALAYLPISSTTEYGKGQRIYGTNHSSKSIYLVVTGKVELSKVAADGSEVLLEILRPDELFGESAFLDASRRAEQATALEKVSVMAWTISEIEDLVMKRPRLAVALLQILAQRNAEFTRHIESLAIDTIERRLARSLLRFSERLGTREEDGSVRMMPLTHEVLSRYVGTSREVVSQYMNKFRRQGYVSYSRRGIFLHADLLRTLLDRSGFPSPDISS
ncbi:MAG: Crp/Fnr family transcriptional regulator [Acidobacteriia bacterium]|nr:Crp/Fnr family transcriptional regulator [Terriglobia bacterium]